MASTFKSSSLPERFLKKTAPEHDLVMRFMDPETSGRIFREANDFGDRVWPLLQGVGRSTRLHRLLTV